MIARSARFGKPSLLREKYRDLLATDLDQLAVLISQKPRTLPNGKRIVETVALIERIVIGVAHARSRLGAWSAIDTDRDRTRGP
jgi:hypothetical protein